MKFKLEIDSVSDDQNLLAFLARIVNTMAERMAEGVDTSYEGDGVYYPIIDLNGNKAGWYCTSEKGDN